MYSIKKSVLVLLCCLGTSCYGQLYEPAIVITLFSDTISCQLKHIRYITGKEELRYKKSLDDKKDLFLSVKDVLWIYTAKDTFECLTVDKGLSKGQASLFRLIEDGYLRLYAKEQFNTSMGGDDAHALFIKKKRMKLTEMSSVDYRKYLLAFTTDYEEAAAKIKDLPYKPYEIALFIRAYNEWYNTPTKNKE